MRLPRPAGYPCTAALGAWSWALRSDRTAGGQEQDDRRSANRSRVIEHPPPEPRPPERSVARQVRRRTRGSVALRSPAGTTVGATAGQRRAAGCTSRDVRSCGRPRAISEDRCLARGETVRVPRERPNFIGRRGLPAVSCNAMDRAGSGAKNQTVGWKLTIQGAHVDDRVTPEGVVGVLQPLVVIEPLEGMTVSDETREWKAFTAACGRDGLTGDRLLLLRTEHSDPGHPGVLEIRHLAGSHSFEVPDTEWAAVDQISKLASVPVIYKFRSRPELVYRGVITDSSNSALDLSGDGPEFWISRFGRARRPNPHINAMQPVSRNLVTGTSPADVFVIDLTRFTMPAKSNCVMCAQPLGGEQTNREHLVPDWIRSLVSEHLGVPVGGVVAAAHESCNAAHSHGEEVIRGFTTRHLSGEDLTHEELSVVAYWMAGRMTLMDRAAGIEPSNRPPLDSSFKSSRTVLTPLYSGRLGDDDHPPFRTLVLGPWVYHCCWTDDGCARDGPVL